MKKITSIALAFLILINSSVVVFAGNKGKYNSEYLSESLEILQALGLQSNTDLSKVDVNVEVTRAQWAQAVAELIQADLSASGDDTVYFYDVPKSHYAAKAINYLASLGAVSGYNNIFNPDEPVTTAAAVKMLFNGLGFANYCELRGGFPEGYLLTAKDAKLFEGITVSDILTEKDMIIILRNVLTVELSMNFSSGGKQSFTINSDGDEKSTLLYRYYKAYFGEGRVTAVGPISIYEGESTAEGNVIIDGTTFMADTESLYPILGEEIDYIYRDDEIIWSRSNGDTEVFVLTDGYANEIAYDERNFSIKYKPEGSGTTKKVSLAQNVGIIYNNEIYSGNLGDVINNSVKEIRFLKTDKSSGYDIAIIKGYKSIFVSGVDTSENVYGSNNEIISIDSNDYELFRVYNMFGARQSASYITKDSLLSVFKSESGKYVDIYVNNSPAKGKVERMSSDEICIDGEVYKVKGEAVLNGVRLGDNVAVYCDIAGYAGYIKSLETSNRYAYLAKMSFGEGRLYLRIFGEDGVMNRYDIDYRITVDGKKMDPEKAYNTLVEKRAVGQVVIFGEKDEKLSFIETASGNRSLYIEYPMSELTYWTKGVYRMGAKVIFDTKTKIFSVPSMDSNDDDEYSVLSVTQLKSDSGLKSYNVESYRTTKDFGTADAMLIKGAEFNTPTTTQNHYIVERITQEVNESGEVAWVIYAYKLDTPLRIVCSSKVNPEEMGLSYGDVIRPLFNNKNEATSINIIWKNDGSKLTLTNSNLEYETRNITGYITDKFEGFIQFGHNLGEYDEALRVDNVPILVCDSSKKKKKIEVGSMADINTYEVAGDNASYVFIQESGGALRYMVIYK